MANIICHFSTEIIHKPCRKVKITVGDIYKRYSVDDLKEMKELNVKFLYMGMESGSDKVLTDIKKGVTQAEMLEAGARIREAGIPFNGSVILGLGGIKDSEEHTPGFII